MLRFKTPVAVLLCLLTGVLLALLFPPADIHVLAPFALTPLLFVLARTERAWRRFLYGWASGFVYWFALCTWIQFVLEVHGGMGRWGGWGSFLLFCLFKALHIAVFSWLAGPMMRKPYAVPAVAALWVGLERTHGTFGFAWLDLGNAGIDMALPLRLAPWVGVYGLSFVFALMAAGLACLLLAYPRWRLTPLLGLPLLWLLPPIPQAVAATDRALLIQPNINPETIWTSLSQWETEQQLTKLSNALSAPLVIWPELPAPLYFYGDRQFHDDAVSVAKQHGAFLFGTVAYTKNNEPLNSAVMLNGDGTEVGRYDQTTLVPFGEYVPPLFSWVNRITKETSDFVPGHDIRVMNGAGHRFGSFICYESAFPDLVRQFTKQGADVLVEMSNDGYFGHLPAREQHLQLGRMRAIENRRFVIRATNDGITAVIDPAGRIVKTLPQFKQVLGRVSYGAVKQTTFYAEHGDWFAWSCLVTAVGLAGWDLVINRRS
jgi:apolipoprotein N-acyltransferase